MEDVWLPSDGVTRAAALPHPYAKLRVNAGLVPAVGKFASLAGIGRSPQASHMIDARRRGARRRARGIIGKNSENFLKLCGVFRINADAIARPKQTPGMPGCLGGSRSARGNRRVCYPLQSQWHRVCALRRRYRGVVARGVAAAGTHCALSFCHIC